MSSSTCGFSSPSDWKHKHNGSLPVPLEAKAASGAQPLYRPDGALLFQQGGFQLTAVGTQNALKKRFLLGSAGFTTEGAVLRCSGFMPLEENSPRNTYQLLRGVGAAPRLWLLLLLLDLTLSDPSRTGPASIPEP